MRLVNPARRHVERARSLGSDAGVGHPRRLAEADASVDVTLLMGPLYHLLEAGDRMAALREGRRVLRPGGLLIPTAISRFAALLDQLIHLDRLHDPDELARSETIVATGRLFARPGGPFTAAFLHLPRQLNPLEVARADFEGVEVVGVKGPGFVVADFERRWDDPHRCEALLVAARLTEQDPEMLAATSHLHGHSPHAASNPGPVSYLPHAHLKCRSALDGYADGRVIERRLWRTYRQARRGSHTRLHTSNMSTLARLVQAARGWSDSLLAGRRSARRALGIVAVVALVSPTAFDSGFRHYVQSEAWADVAGPFGCTSAASWRRRPWPDSFLKASTMWWFEPMDGAF